MFDDLQMLAERAVMERTTLLLNHVIAAEPAAMQRLRGHSGSALQVEFTGWPAFLPPLRGVAFGVTPAGLVEWLGNAPVVSADLRITVDASNPMRALAQMFTGVKPEVTVAGDAGFAADVDWLIANLRWDVEDDLARVVGVAPAHQISRLARLVADGVRKAARTLGDLADRNAPGASVGPLPR